MEVRQRPIRGPFDTASLANDFLCASTFCCVCHKLRRMLQSLRVSHDHDLGGFTLWPDSHRRCYYHMETEINMEPLDGYSDLLASIKADIVPVEIAGQAGGMRCPGSACSNPGFNLDHSKPAVR